MTSLASQKKLAARVMKVSRYRVKLKQTKEVEEALTANDIREAIKKGIIWKVQKEGQNTSFSRKRRKQKKRGRRTGHGSRKGKPGAMIPDKRQWINSVRPLRRLLAGLRAGNQLEEGSYRKLYMLIKGGFFRNKKHLLNYLKENEMLIGKKPRKKMKEVSTTSR